MAHRYFTTHIYGESASITGADATHLARVLRAQPGEQLILCDGANTDYTAEVLAVSPEEVSLRILEQHPSAAEPDVWVEAFIGYARGERLEWALQKSVELGASALTPFFSEFSVVKPKKEEDKNQRYNRIAQEAAKQCGRGILPQVAMPLTFSQVLTKAPDFDLMLFFYEGGGLTLRKALGNARRIALITGPEGGFSLAEAEAARAAGCVTIGLGPRILRSETAPAAALAAIMTLTGNLE